MILEEDGNGWVAYRSTTWPTVKCYRISWEIRDDHLWGRCHGASLPTKLIGDCSGGWVASNEYRKVSEIYLGIGPGPTMWGFLVHRTPDLSEMRREIADHLEEYVRATLETERQVDDVIVP